jgi:hypothetical protein
MKKVFSFTLFGAQDKYCKGLLLNIQQIQRHFPDFEVWVYIGNDVPSYLIDTLSTFQNVHRILTNENGNVNKFYRFFAIDNPEVELMIVRDVDSRIYSRDISVINDFVQSDKLFHIIRDHPNHFHKILAGAFAIRKGLLAHRLQDIFDEYKQTREVTTFWNDQEFLAEIFWPRVLSVSMIHDELQEFEPYSIKTPIKESIGDGLHFIGQVYEFDENGNEYPKFTDFFDGGVHGNAFWTAERKARLGIT